MNRMVIVLALLFIPATCLAVPISCPEDLQGITLAVVVSLDGEMEPDTLAMGRVPARSGQPDYPFDDECFCCCRHAVPQHIFSPGGTGFVVELSLGMFPATLSGASDPPYHHRDCPDLVGYPR